MVDKLCRGLFFLFLLFIITFISKAWYNYWRFHSFRMGKDSNARWWGKYVHWDHKFRVPESSSSRMTSHPSRWCYSPRICFCPKECRKTATSNLPIYSIVSHFNCSSCHLKWKMSPRKLVTMLGVLCPLSPLGLIPLDRLLTSSKKWNCLTTGVKPKPQSVRRISRKICYLSN